MFKPGCKSCEPRKPTDPRVKWIYIGAPACFQLELAVQQVAKAFDAFHGNGGIYVVGSVLQRPDWRDVDIRFIMSDEEFFKEFPGAGCVNMHAWEHDTKWLFLTSLISKHLSEASGLPVDFQFQPQSHANNMFGRPYHTRNPIGLSLLTRVDK